MFERIKETWKTIRGDKDKVIEKKRDPSTLPSRGWKGWKTRSKKRVIIPKE